MRVILAGRAIDDSFPGVALEHIASTADRARSLLVRNADQTLTEEGVLSITGAINMVAGLEYHHANFMAAYSAVQEGEALDKLVFSHEVIAYCDPAYLVVAV